MAGVNLSKARERLDNLRKQKEERKKLGDFINLVDGENILRFMPPWNQMGEWVKEAWYHFNFAEKPLLCPKKTYNEDECPLCDFVDALFKTKDPEDKKAAKERMAKVRYFASVLNLKDKDAKDRKRIRVLSFGTKIYEELLGYFVDEDYGDFTDPTKGMDVKIERSGEGLETKYTIRVRRQPSAVEDFQEIFKGVIDLDKRVDSERRSIEDLKHVLDTGELPDKASTTEDKDEEPAEETAPEPEKASKDDDGFGGKEVNPERGNTAETKPVETKAETTAPAKSEQKSKLEDQMARLRKRAGK